ncbi:MAG: hypothetical protein ABL909_06695 [Sphingopyxis sp.]
MILRTALTALMLMGGAVTLSAQAQAEGATTTTTETPIADGEDIVVTGMGTRGYRLTADQLRDAVRAFNTHRNEYAPQATLTWRVIPVAEAEGLEIRLVSGDERIDLPIDAAGEFSLPAERILNGNWRLQTNAGRRQIRIRPQTFSPGGSDADMRMGDARLMCRVYWAFVNNEMSVFTRAMFGAIGGCGSRRVAIYYRSERLIATATAGTTAFDVRPDGSAFRPLLHDRVIDNETRIRLTYR